jgi:radical SAM-linked protein
VRYLIKFSKEGNIKFISHLDLQRTLQRNFKRSGLPVEYSKGFNPHILMSLAQPLAVGIYSKGEYLDISFIKEENENVIIDKLNRTAPSGIKYFKAIKLKEGPNKKVFKAMAAVAAAKYIIQIKYNNTKKLEHELKNLLNMDNWDIIKKGKKGSKNINIRPMVKKIDYVIEDNLLKINTLVSCGSIKNLSADLLAKFIKENTSDVKQNSFVDIERQEIYGEYKNKLVALSDYAMYV